jgi:hypothetical protein
MWYGGILVSEAKGEDKDLPLSKQNIAQYVFANINIYQRKKM